MSTQKSNVKAQLCTDHSPAERERVQRQQDYAKEKLQEVKQLDVTQVPKELPSNEQIVSALQHGQESLEKVKQSEKGQQLPRQGEKVVEDIQRVLADQEVLIQSKNEGDILQKIVRDFWALLQELRQRNDFRVFFEEWQGTLTSVFSSGDFTQFFQQVNELFTSISDTEEFLALVSEIIDLTKLVIAESTEKVVAGGEGSAELQSMREAETRRVSKELRRTLAAMAENDIWKSLVEKSKRKSNQVQEVREQSGTHSTEEVFYRIKDLPQFQQLIDDFKLLLQRFVGSKMSVDPLFDYSKKAFDNIINDDELASVVDEMQRLLPSIAENPALLQEKQVQDELDILSKRADDLVHRFRNDPNVEGAKKESQRLVEVIKSSSSGNKLLDDLKTLWRDISSDNEGESIDPDVLKSLRQLIVPFLIEHLNNVPLPAVHDEFTFLGKYLYTLDNMKISLPELIPENIHLRFEYEMDAKPLELEVQNQHTYLFLQASNLKLHLHDCYFTYDRVTVPKHSDSGVFDVDTKGEGLTIRMKMEIKSDPNKGQYLDILRTDTRIGRFEISFRDSKHDQLYEMMTHLFQSRIKRGILDLIKTRLVDFGTYFNDQIIAIVNQAKKSSHDIAKFAREKTEQAKRGAEQLKTKAQEGIQKPDVQESKEEAVSSGKKLLVKASEKAQEGLDKVKSQVDEERTKREASRTTGTAADILNITPEICPTHAEKSPSEPAFLAHYTPSP